MCVLVIKYLALRNISQVQKNTILYQTHSSNIIKNFLRFFIIRQLKQQIPQVLLRALRISIKQRVEQRVVNYHNDPNFIKFKSLFLIFQEVLKQVQLTEYCKDKE